MKLSTVRRSENDHKLDKSYLIFEEKKINFEIR